MTYCPAWSGAVRFEKKLLLAPTAVSVALMILTGPHSGGIDRDQPVVAPAPVLDPGVLHHDVERAPRGYVPRASGTVSPSPKVALAPLGVVAVTGNSVFPKAFTGVFSE